jgi:uncharacterized protein YbcI
VSQHPSPEVARSADRGPLSSVCAGVSALIRERWGRGPKRSRAHWAGPDTLLVMLEDSLTDAERTLAGSGHHAAVLDGRRTLASLNEPDLRRIVEQSTHRSVCAVLVQSHLAPDVTSMVFVFDRAPRDGDGDAGGEARLDNALRRALDETTSARALVAESEQTARHTAEERARRKAERDAGPSSQPRPGAT